MIILFTDFGDSGPYGGQMKAVLGREAPGIQIIDLLHDAPAFEAKWAAYLFASFIDIFPTDVVFLCVVDPGVGSDRRAIVVEADGRRYVGPDNGLFELVIRRANTTRLWHITWEPETLSASFHGRDLFAPVAAMLARGEPVPGEERPIEEARRPDWPDDLAEIVYIDNFGNAMTGIRAASLKSGFTLEANGRKFDKGRTFSDAEPGAAFWYENSNGLAEIAVNQGRARELLGLSVGSPVTIVDGAA